MMLRRHFPFGAAVAVLGLGWLTPGSISWSFAETETITETYKVSGTPDIELEGFNGKIVIEEGSEDEVRIRCTKYVQSWTGIGASRALDRIKVDISREGDSIRVIAERPHDVAGWLQPSAGVNFELEVPKVSRINARTTNGAVVLESIAGEIQVTSTNGSIKIDDVGGEIAARTTNGAINAELNDGSLNVISTNGSIYVEGRSKELHARTTNGRIAIDLEDDLASEINAATTNGSITIEGRLIGKNEFLSSNGSVTVALPADSTFHVDAQTSNGSVVSEFDLDDVKSERKRSLQGRRGDDPKTTIRIRTSNSSIRITEG